MKKLVVIMFGIVCFFMGSLAPIMVTGAVDGITADNYLEYEKPIRDEYGYNKGECDTPYQDGEEQFYSDSYDHWNVDKVYDSSLVVTEEDTTEESEPVEDEPEICPYCGQEIPK